MEQPDIVIRPPTAQDADAWRTLWGGYCAFYEVSLPEAVTARTWERICDPRSGVGAIVAEHERLGVIGICNYVVHENTWELQPVCYLEDLYVAPGERAAGVGRMLIDWLVESMRTQGWSRLYWMTREDNYRARALYDKFAPRDGFVRYVVKPAAA